MTLKVGLIVGREWSFPPAFIEEVNRRDEGVVAEYVKLGAPHMDAASEYAVIIDRISHEVPFYRTYLKQAALMGCTVVNNPFMWTADDKFFGAALATKLGIAHPKTVVLPNKEYIPGVIHEESLRNLEYPLDWQGVIDYVGLPCILKDAHGGGWKDVYVCRSLEELIHHYDTSGLLTMVVQEFIEWDQFIRCICIGQDKVMPIKYDPRERRYHVEHEHMSPELGQRVIADSLKLVRALGYDMNSMEWAVRDGIPYAIDFMNPAPDMDIYSLTPHYFEWAVQSMADMAINLARNPRPQGRDLRWDALFTGTRHAGDDGSAGAASSGFARAGAADEGPHGSGSGGRTEPTAGLAQSSVDFGAADTGLFASSAGEGPHGSGSGGRTAPSDAGSPLGEATPGVYVDESPRADLEPPVEATAEGNGSSVGASPEGNASSVGAAPSAGSSTDLSSQPISRGTPGIYVDESPFPEVQPPTRAPRDAEPPQAPPGGASGGAAGEPA
jgi:hypothetical protein